MRKRILIVDDNRDILEIVQETLAYEQFDVMGMSEPTNVLDKVKEFKPDLVILDYRLGDITGGEICLQIKATPEFNNLPVIIFTAYVNRSEELLAYGCDDTIDKPFNLSELIFKVNNLITDLKDEQ